MKLRDHHGGESPARQEHEVVIVQPCIPNYRVPFFRELADMMGDQARLSIIYSQADENGVRTPDRLREMIGSRVALVQVDHKALLGWALFWQRLPGEILREADIVVVNWNLRYLSTVCLVIGRALQKRRMVGWGHYHSRSGNRLVEYLRQRMIRIFETFWCYTEQDAIRAASENPKLKGRVVGLNNGIEVDTSRLGQIQVAARNKSSVEACKFLFIGRVTPKSEFPVLLEALRLLAFTESEPVISVDVIGEVDERLREQSTHAQHSDRIHYHGPVFDPDVIHKIAATCHYFVYPGSVGLSLLHAFSLGLPALIHDQPRKHMPEIAAAVIGRNTLLFRRGDPQQLADTMRQAAALPAADYIKMVDACIGTVRDDFNVDRMVKKAVGTLLGV